MAVPLATLVPPARDDLNFVNPGNVESEELSPLPFLSPFFLSPFRLPSPLFFPFFSFFSFFFLEPDNLYFNFNKE